MLANNNCSFLIIVMLITLFAFARAQVDLKDYFGNCQITEETFDNCLKDGLNNLRPFYKTGLPSYGIEPFDPFFAKTIVQKRDGAVFNYKLVLHNVTESGWTVSQVTDLKFDLNKRSMEYTQFFPDKQLNGWYEIQGSMLGSQFKNKGRWTLGLYDFIQTTQLTRKARRDANDNLIANPPIKANVFVKSSKRLELHIGNLVGGRTVVENMLDWVINTAWQPGFLVLRPLINDLVSTAFTEIFNKSFQGFPFDEIFTE